MYNTVIFDLDDTLIDNFQNVKNAFKEVLKYRNEDYTEEKFKNFFEFDREFWSKRAKGEIEDPIEFENADKRREWVRAKRFLIYFNDEISYEEAVRINDLYIDALAYNIIPIEGAFDVVKYLYEKKYKIVIATNGPILAINSKLKACKIDKYVNFIFSAEEAGHMKPRKEFFEGLFKKIGSNDTSKMIIIGDELEKDVKGGLDNNIDTCWFNRKFKNRYTDEEIKMYPHKYEITRLEELKEIL